jgi:hypothetical protein
MIELLDFFNNSKILAGLCIILMNLGSRYVISDLGIIHNKILSSELFKKLIIFAIFFVATRDIMISFMLTISYVLIIDGILHEKRKFCIIPKEYIKDVQMQISEQEYNKAKDIILKYESKKVTSETNQENLINSVNSNSNISDISNILTNNNLNIYDTYKKNLLILNNA